MVTDNEQLPFIIWKGFISHPPFVDCSFIKLVATTVLLNTVLWYASKTWGTFAETTSVTVPLCRYKRSSRRSVSEAVPHFTNLCVYEISALQKKLCDFRHSCDTNTCLEKSSKGQIATLLIVVTPATIMNHTPMSTSSHLLLPLVAKQQPTKGHEVCVH